LYALEIARLGMRLYSPGQRVAWCGVVAPFDLLNAMGVNSCFVEFVGAMLASTGTIGPLLDHAEQAGYATDACGYHRAIMGAARQGMMPVPDFLVATSIPCSGGLAVIDNLTRLFARDLFVLHVPPDEAESGVRYLSGQLRELTEFVARHTGEKPDPAKLRKAVELSNQARELLVDVYKLAAHVPSPAASRDLRNFGIVMALFLGTQAAVDLAQAYRRDFAARIADQRSGAPGEHLRLLWIQNRIQFKNPLEDMLEREYKAVIVADELNQITWDPIDPDDPFPGMARRAISIPLNGPIERRIEGLKKMAEAYKIDGVINPCHWGCRQGTGARGMIGESLKNIGLPVLNLEVDCVDTRNFAEGQLKTRLDAFMEMLAGRPSPWR